MPLLTTQCHSTLIATSHRKRCLSGWECVGMARWLTLFLYSNLYGDGYLRILNKEIVPQSEALFPHQVDGSFREIWWIQDEAPAHRRMIVRVRLVELFNERVGLPDRLISRHATSFCGATWRARCSQAHRVTWEICVGESLHLHTRLLRRRQNITRKEHEFKTQT